jgi:hypothetical protein
MIQEHENIAKVIQAISIDTQEFPPSLTHVPTLIHENELYVGKQAFDYIFAMSKQQPTQQNQNVTPGNNQKQQNQNVTPGNNQKQQKDLTGMELGSSFSFIGGGSDGFRFDSGLSSCSIKDSLETRYGDVEDSSGKDNNKPDTPNLMDKLKTQRDSEIVMPLRRV